MIRILLCCGGGFSSSAIATRMKKEIKEKNLEDKYSIEFLPFGLGLKELNCNYDINQEKCRCCVKRAKTKKSNDMQN